MSIEKLIEENTRALLHLAEILGGAALAGETPKTKAPKVKPAATLTPVEAAADVPPLADAESTNTEEVSFEVLVAAFRKVVLEDRDKAVAFLAARGISKLIQLKPEQYAGALVEIKGLCV